MPQTAGPKPLLARPAISWGLLHERRAVNAADRVVRECEEKPLVAAEQWQNAICNADKFFRNALRKGVSRATQDLCRLHRTEEKEHEARPGDDVRMCGLISEEGRRLNGRLGVITEYVESTGRYGMRIEGAEKPKYILPMHLIFLGSEDDYVGP